VEVVVLVVDVEVDVDVVVARLATMLRFDIGMSRPP